MAPGALVEHASETSEDEVLCSVVNIEILQFFLQEEVKSLSENHVQGHAACHVIRILRRLASNVIKVSVCQQFVCSSLSQLWPHSKS